MSKSLFLFSFVQPPCSRVTHRLFPWPILTWPTWHTVMHWVRTKDTHTHTHTHITHAHTNNPQTQPTYCVQRPSKCPPTTAFMSHLILLCTKDNTHSHRIRTYSFLFLQLIVHSIFLLIAAPFQMPSLNLGTTQPANGLQTLQV